MHHHKNIEVGPYKRYQRCWMWRKSCRHEWCHL